MLFISALWYLSINSPTCLDRIFFPSPLSPLPGKHKARGQAGCSCIISKLVFWMHLVMESLIGFLKTLPSYMFWRQGLKWSNSSYSLKARTQSEPKTKIHINVNKYLDLELLIQVFRLVAISHKKIDRVCSLNNPWTWLSKTVCGH